jgi:hypothetical protein
LDPKLITPLLLSVFVAWAVYRRVRRNFGRQPVNTRRLQFRIGLLTVVATLVLFSSVRDMALIGALLAGFACGAALGYFGLQHTKFEATAQGRFYTPHTYIGLFVTALFLSRIVFRFLAVYLDPHAAAQPNQNLFDAYHKSSLTWAILGVLIGYYVLFYSGILRRSRGLALPATDTANP